MTGARGLRIGLGVGMRSTLEAYEGLGTGVVVTSETEEVGLDWPSWLRCAAAVLVLVGVPFSLGLGEMRAVKAAFLLFFLAGGFEGRSTNVGVRLLGFMTSLGSVARLSGDCERRVGWVDVSVPVAVAVSTVSVASAALGVSSVPAALAALSAIIGGLWLVRRVKPGVAACTEGLAVTKVGSRGETSSISSSERSVGVILRLGCRPE
jgi:hypothetical protein